MRLTRRLLAALVTLFASGARADAPPPAAPAAAASTTSLALLADEIVKQLGPEARGAKVSAEALRTDQPLKRGEELVSTLTSLLAGRLDAGTAKARTAMSKVVVLKPEVAKGELRVTADLLQVSHNRWDRLKQRDAAQVGHAFASRPVDAEIRAYFPPIVLEQASIHRAKHEESEPLALACGDIDGDGGNELLIVSRSRVALGRLRAGKFVVERTRLWADVGKRVPVPLSEPIGGATLGTNGAFAGTTDFGGYRFDGALGNAVAVSGVPLVVTGGTTFCATPSPEAFGFEGLLQGCEGKGTSLLLSSTRFDTASALRLPAKSGKEEEVVLAREGAGRLRLRSSSRTGTQALENVGAQALLADLDLDGVPEIVTSSDAPLDDSAYVYSWKPEGLALRRKIPAPGGIRGFAVCPPEEGAVPALAMLVGSEVWIVR